VIVSAMKVSNPHQASPEVPERLEHDVTTHLMQCFHKHTMSFDPILHNFNPHDPRLWSDGQFDEIGPMIYKSLPKQNVMTQLNERSSISSSVI
jgi:hypothetical protein